MWRPRGWRGGGRLHYRHKKTTAVCWSRREKVPGVLSVTSSCSALCVPKQSSEEGTVSIRSHTGRASRSKATCFTCYLMLFSCNLRCVSFPEAVTPSPMTSSWVCVCGWVCTRSEALHCHEAEVTPTPCNHTQTHMCGVKFNDQPKHKICVQTKQWPTLLFLLIRGCS